ncbi:uncharacterized protein LOC141899553 isoform X2 [Tubulanus polymorphus]|uniref:uncharacterized protein LOC141899553 isoform X2 n=1 Tax=Tubulanus polymorphus TaxID=672921 RepID=UPI003DA67AB4
MTSVKLAVDVPSIVSIKILRQEKWHSMVVCDKNVFSVKVKWSNKTSTVIYRTYGMLYEFQKMVGPIETNGDFTFLPGFSDFSNIDTTEMRMYVVEQFLQDLLKNCPFTSHFLSFFTCRPFDIKIGKLETQGKSSKPTWLKRAVSFLRKKKPHSELYGTEEGTGERECFRYKVVQRFSGRNKHELTVYEATEVDVIEKTVRGWWLVQLNAQVGWVPSAMLEPYTGQSEEFGLSGTCPDGRLCVSLANYEAKHEDELSLESGSTVELLSAYTDGWWLVWFQGDMGIVPACHLMEIDIDWIPPDYSSFPMKHKPFRYCGLPPLPGEKYKPKIPPRRLKAVPLTYRATDHIFREYNRRTFTDESKNNNKPFVNLDENSNENPALKSKIALTHSNHLGANKQVQKDLRAELFTPESYRRGEIDQSPFSSTRAVHGSSSTIPFEAAHLSLASDLENETDNHTPAGARPAKTAKELIEAFGALEQAAAQIKRGFEKSFFPKITEQSNLSVQCNLTPGQLYMKGECPYLTKTEKPLVSDTCLAALNTVDNPPRTLKFCNLTARNTSTPNLSPIVPFIPPSILNKKIQDDNFVNTIGSDNDFAFDFDLKLSIGREGPLERSQSDSDSESDPLNMLDSCTIFPVPKRIPRIKVTSPEGNVSNIIPAPKQKKWQKTPSPAKVNPRDRLKSSLKQQLTAARLKRCAERHSAREQVYNRHRKGGPYTKLTILLSDFESGKSRKLDTIRVPVF